MAMQQSFQKSLGTSDPDRGFSITFKSSLGTSETDSGFTTTFKSDLGAGEGGGFTTTFHESFRGAYPPTHEWDGTKLRFMQPDGSWGIWKDTREGLGTAADKDAGTGADEVPTNSDLGTASTKDVGTASAEIPQNSDLGSAAYEYIGNASSEIPTYSILASNGLVIGGDFETPGSVSAGTDVLTDSIKEKTTDAGIDYVADEHRFDGPLYAPGTIVQWGYVRTDARNSYSAPGGTSYTEIPELEIAITPRFSNSLIHVEWYIGGEGTDHNIGFRLTINGNQPSDAYNMESGNEAWSVLAHNNYDGNENSTPQIAPVHYIFQVSDTSEKVLRPTVKDTDSSGSSTFRMNRAEGSSGSSNYETQVSWGFVKEIAQSGV